MTSTNIQVGLSEKQTSRVNKPPGGGHSDIFGIRKDETAFKTPSKRNHPVSTISSCFTTDSPKKIVNEDKIQNGNGVIIDENVAPVIENGNDEEKLTEPKIVEAETPKGKSRVPPGGYSTALW